MSSANARETYVTAKPFENVVSPGTAGWKSDLPNLSKVAAT